MSQETALYRFFDAGNKLLYIGISVRFVSRLEQHESTKEWSDDITFIRIERHPTRELAVCAERKAIIAEKPIHNIHHQPNEKEHATIAVQIKKPEDLEIIDHIKKSGGNLSEVIRQLLRQHRDNGYRSSESNPAI